MEWDPIVRWLIGFTFTFCVSVALWLVVATVCYRLKIGPFREPPESTTQEGVDMTVTGKVAALPPNPAAVSYSDMLGQEGVYRVDDRKYPACRVIVLARRLNTRPPTVLFLRQDGTAEPFDLHDTSWPGFRFLPVGPAEVTLRFS